MVPVRGGLELRTGRRQSFRVRILGGLSGAPGALCLGSGHTASTQKSLRSGRAPFRSFLPFRDDEVRGILAWLLGWCLEGELRGQGSCKARPGQSTVDERAGAGSQLGCGLIVVCKEYGSAAG